MEPPFTVFQWMTKSRIVSSVAVCVHNNPSQIVNSPLIGMLRFSFYTVMFTSTVNYRITGIACTCTYIPELGLYSWASHFIVSWWVCHCTYSVFHICIYNIFNFEFVTWTLPITLWSDIFYLHTILSNLFTGEMFSTCADLYSLQQESLHMDWTSLLQID